MINCPSCDAENIPGSDTCDQCGQALSETHLPTPATEVERSLLTDRVSVLSPKTPVVAKPDMRLGDALNLLVEKGIGSILIAEQDQLLGIFSERDALIKVGEDAKKFADRPISDFMTPDPQSLPEQSKIAFAVQRMDLGGFRHVPIVDEKGAPTGVISVRDILSYLTDKMAAEST